MKQRKQLIETLAPSTETASKLEEEFVRKGTAELDQPPPVALAPDPQLKLRSDPAPAVGNNETMNPRFTAFNCGSH